MPGFAVGDFGSAPILGGGWDHEPVSPFDAFTASADSVRDVDQAGAREERLRQALWARDRLIRQRTGQQSQPSMTMIGQAQVGADAQFGLSTRGNGWVGDDDYESWVDKLRQQHPDVMADIPTAAQVQKGVGNELRGIARAGAAAAQDHPVASFLGGAAETMTEPSNIVAMAVAGPAGAGTNLAARAGIQALAWGTTAALAAPQKMDEAQGIGGPAYTLADAGKDVTANALFGAAGEVGIAGMGRLWRTVRPHLPALASSPAARGAAQALEREAMADQAVGPLRHGEDFEAGLDALDRAEPAPAIEPDSDIGDLFAAEPSAPVALRPVNDGGRGDLVTSEYRGRAIHAGQFDPAELTAAPEVFQYKADGDAAGVTDRLRGVERWDPLSSGKVVVWEDAAGKRFIADGHQRLGLAKRMAAQGWEPVLDGYLMRQADGWAAPEVRTFAALKNIREGQGTPLDAAKVLRTSPGAIEDGSLPVSGPFMAQARGLARLSDPAWGAVVNKVIPENYAALIGQLAGDRPDLHASIVNLLHAADPANAEEAGAIIHEAKLEDWRQGEGETSDLFGDLPLESSLIARGKVKAAIARQLRGDARVFGQLVRHADAIEAGGNTLARNANEQQAALSSAALEIISKMSLRKGPIGDLLNEAALRVAKGEASAAVASKAVTAAVKDELARGASLDALRGEVIAPAAPEPQAVEKLDLFGEPGGKGQAEQLQPKPEDAAFEAAPAMAQPAAARPMVRRGDLYTLSQDELQALYDEAKLSDREKVVKALGSEDAAKEFERLQRTMNNTMDPGRADRASAEFDQKFGNLTPEQERLIYGNIDDPELSPDEIKPLLDAHSDVMPGDDADWAAYMASVAARRTDVADFKAVIAGEGTPEAQASFVRMQRAAEAMAAQGVAANEIPQRMVQALVDRAGWRPKQAAEIIGGFVDDMTKGHEPAPPPVHEAPALPAPVREPAPAPAAPAEDAPPPGLFDDVPENTEHAILLQRLTPCAPAGAAAHG